MQPFPPRGRPRPHRLLFFRQRLWNWFWKYKGGMRLIKIYTHYMIGNKYSMVLLTTVAEKKRKSNIRLFSYSLQSVLLMTDSGWEGMSGGNKHLSRKNEGTKVYMYATELLLLYFLTEQGKWLHSYCSYLPSNAGKATTPTPSQDCVWLAAQKERMQSEKYLPDSQPPPWWEGHPPPQNSKSVSIPFYHTWQAWWKAETVSVPSLVSCLLFSLSGRICHHSAWWQIKC